MAAVGLQNAQKRQKMALDSEKFFFENITEIVKLRG